MRKKTSSVTQLVKEVANEQIDSAINNHLQVDHPECGKAMRGSRWSLEEDETLHQEFLAFCHLSAMLHRRTVGSILARVNDKISEYRY